MTATFRQPNTCVHFQTAVSWRRVRTQSTDVSSRVSRLELVSAGCRSAGLHGLQIRKFTQLAKTNRWVRLASVDRAHSESLYNSRFTLRVCITRAVRSLTEFVLALDVAHVVPVDELVPREARDVGAPAAQVELAAVNTRETTGCQRRCSGPGRTSERRPLLTTWTPVTETTSTHQQRDIRDHPLQVYTDI